MKKAIIIGAGPAGLTAAWQMLKTTEMIPVILEESPYIGGISRTAEYHGNRMDLGGHRFFSKSAKVRAIWQEIMPLQGAPAWDDRLLEREKEWAEGGPDPEKTDRVMLLRERVSRIFYLRKFFDYPISIKPETFANMGLARTVKAGMGYLTSCVHKREEKSLEDFYINRFGRPLYEMFFEDYTAKLWGVHPSEIAPDWGAQRVKGLSLMKAVTSVLTKPFRKGEGETSLIEQFSYPKRGPGQLWEQMAEEIRRMGGEIRLNTRVTGLALRSGRVEEVLVQNAAGEKQRLAGDWFFSSMPVKDLVAAIEGEEVPADVSRIAGALPYRDFMTVGLLVDRMKIQNRTKRRTVANIVPDCWIYIQERDVRIGRLQVFNNWSPYMVKDPQHTVWLGLEYFCTEGDGMWTMDDRAFIDFAAGELEKIGIIDRADVLDSHLLRVKKAYPAYFGTYAEFDRVRAYLDGIENLLCIGRNGQHRYNNMDHSMLTALEAVEIARRGGGDRESLWNVNTEEVYHESDAQDA